MLGRQGTKGDEVLKAVNRKVVGSGRVQTTLEKDSAALAVRCILYGSTSTALVPVGRRAPAPVADPPAR